MENKELEKLKETVNGEGCAIYRNDTEVYRMINDLSDEDMELFTEWLIQNGYELRYRNDEDLFIIC